jgi:hypothetical protein
MVALIVRKAAFFTGGVLLAGGEKFAPQSRIKWVVTGLKLAPWRRHRA